MPKQKIELCSKFCFNEKKTKISIFSLDWTKVADKKECGGSEKDTGTKKTLGECAKSCREISSMFIYGTNDFGSTKCKTNGKEDCPCYCETSSEDGKCQMVENEGYKLYKYVDVNGGNKKTHSQKHTYIHTSKNNA